MSDEGAMISVEKPEIRNVLKIGWTIVRGILELAIMLYVLAATLEPGDRVIVAVLGIIYATIRSANISPEEVGEMAPTCTLAAVLRCPWRIRKSCRDRHLEQAAAVMPPSVVVKDGMGGRPLARSFSRSTAIERLVNAMFVVIISELFQLSLQVDCVPD